MKIKYYLAIASLLTFIFPSALFADVVPYSVQSIKSKGSGYVELVGPGKIKTNGDILPYEGTKYIRISNIGWLC